MEIKQKKIEIYIMEKLIVIKGKMEKGKHRDVSLKIRFECNGMEED